MKKSLLLILCLLIFCITQAFTQNRTITGMVTAKDDGQSIPGVSVKIKGTPIAVVTDQTGKYAIMHVPEGATLVFAFSIKVFTCLLAIALIGDKYVI